MSTPTKTIPNDGDDLARGHLIIPVELPTLEEYSRAERSGYVLFNAFKRKWVREIANYARKQLHPINYPRLSFIFKWYLKNENTKPDEVAFAKQFIIDGLAQARIIGDDTGESVESFMDTFEIDGSYPRVEVLIY